jgi:hypothetical protein
MKYVAVFDRGLSSTEIESIYNQGVSLSDSDLVGYWGGDQITATQIQDQSGNSGHGTFFGGAQSVGLEETIALTDVLVVSGDVRLEGALVITTVNDFQPVTGDSFQIISCNGTISGGFDSYDLPSIPLYTTWNVSQIMVNGTISVTLDSRYWVDDGSGGLALDRDSDDVPDVTDPFPDLDTEWLDTDGDNIGDNSDPDDDNDGLLDIYDGKPLHGHNPLCQPDLIPIRRDPA